MHIVVRAHSTELISLQYSGDNSNTYTLYVYNTNNVLILQSTSNTTYVCIKHKFNCGSYVIVVKTEKSSYTIHSVVPAICRLSTGGCGVLVNGFAFGINSPVLLTANHCIANPNNTVAYFNTIPVKLAPDMLYVNSERYKYGGIDYCCIAIRKSDLIALRDMGILPHEPSRDAFGYSSMCLLTHYNIANGDVLLKTSCAITKREVGCVRYEYMDDFPKSSGGSSGSPVFGFDENNKLTLQGIHIGYGKCTTVSTILSDMKAKLLNATHAQAR